MIILKEHLYKIIFFGLLILAVTFVSINSSAQSATTVNESLKKTNIGIFFSPDYSSGKIPNGVLVSGGFNTRSKIFPVLGYSAGANFNYYYNNRFSLITGLVYSKKGYIKEFYYRNKIDFTWSDTSSEIRTYKYIEIPIKVKYDFRISNIKLFVSAGLGYSKIIRSTLELRNFSNYPSLFFDFTSLEKPNLSMMAGLGTEMKLMDNLFLTINPEIRRMRNQNYFSAETRLFSIGLNTGINLKL